MEEVNAYLCSTEIAESGCKTFLFSFFDSERVKIKPSDWLIK
ncbi:unnamed protein product [Arabidopsis halleri]